MDASPSFRLLNQVAPLAGSVDRNRHHFRKRRLPRVAPLAGSVDRNGELAGEADAAIQVAPLAGSVDRNGSLDDDPAGVYVVAPLAGSVDRNSWAAALSAYQLSRSPRGERG